MGGKRLSWIACAGLVTFALATIAGILAEGGSEMFASITALECLILVAVLRPTSFTYLDGGRAMLAFAISVPWSGVHLVEHMDINAGFGARVVWLVVAQLTLLIIAAASWAHCRWGMVVAGDPPRARALR